MFSGCKPVGPDYHAPVMDMPADWQEKDRPGLPHLVPDETLIKKWWVLFDDPVLCCLIGEAAERNYDIRTAVARVEEAWASVGVTSGTLYPTLSASGSVQRQRTSKNSINGVSVEYTDHELGLASNWELDLFGKVRRSIEASEGDYQASEEDRNGIMIGVYAEVARTYFAVRTAQARLESAERNIKSQEEIVKLTKTRFEFGLASDLEVAQSEQVLTESQAMVPGIRTDLETNMYALALLLGHPPGVLHKLLTETKSVHTTRNDIAVGVPLDLLRRRPDVRQAERQLAAQTARIGVATADLYPNFTLSGALGLASISTGSLFLADSRTYQAGLNLGWNLFAGGSLRSQIKVEDARAKQALLNYEQTVLKSLKEVESALVTYAENHNSAQAYRESVKVAQRTLKLSLELYKDGLTDFQSTLDAERTVFDAENNAAVAIGNTATSLVTLFEALGGGWDPDCNGYIKYPLTPFGPMFMPTRKI